MNINKLISNARFTILLGKNGSGKSTLLRKLDSSNEINSKYISPERGGTLKYDPNVDLNISNNDKWMINDRRKNRTEQFRQQSTAQFRNLEVLVLREIEKDEEKRSDATYTFDTTLEKINSLLPAISLIRADRGFSITNKAGAPIKEDDISSGEAELIALAIEVLVFSRSSEENKVLLMDEPDVHLHPDLQQRFIEFIERTATEYEFKVVLATHSTAIVGAFSLDADLQIAPITSRDQAEFKSFSYDPICQEILPVFGAHPLSSQFNKSPVLLVEGDDDKRVFDQVIRSGNGRYSFSPCVVGTVDDLNKWEAWLNEYLPSIYDDPTGYSIRDLDSAENPNMDDLEYVIRCKLNCYAIENILLTDTCIEEHGISVDEFLEVLQSWRDNNPKHQSTEEISNLIDNFDNRRTIKIKELRNVIVALLGSTKPWEIIIGQLIVNHREDAAEGKHSLRNYLGAKVLEELLS